MGESDTMLPHQYCLRWKFHNANIQSTFSKLLEKDSFCDVTLWCCGSAVRAHRAVLASCSTLLCTLLASHDASLGEPAFLLDSVELKHLKYILAFMYTGEVSVHHTELAVLLKTAEDLRVKGLADISWRDKSSNVESSPPGQATPSTQIGPLNNNWTSTRPVVSETAGNPYGILNGSSGFSSMTPRPLPTLQIEPIKRKRGRPPLEPRLPLLEEPIIGALSPKRVKMVSPMPNILRKSKIIDKDDSPNMESTDNVQPSEASVKNDQLTVTEELSSEYSEASLDGRDISQFLDTTMEEEETEAAEHPDIGPEKIDPPNGIDAEDEKNKDPIVVETPPSESAESAPVNPLTAKASISKQFASDLEQLHKAQLLPNRQQNQQQILQQFSDVVKLQDYLLRGRRPQFWAEDYVKRVMEAVFCKELEMKQAAEMLGVSYGTLYGRYRDCFGCINRPHRVRDFWNEQGPSEILTRLRRKDISLFKAAEILNVTPQTLSVHLASVGDQLTLPFGSIKTDNEDDEDLDLDNEDYDNDNDGRDNYDYGEIMNLRDHIPNEGYEEQANEAGDDCEVLSDEDTVENKNILTIKICKSDSLEDSSSIKETDNEKNDHVNIEDQLRSHTVIASKDNSSNLPCDVPSSLNEVTGKLDTQESKKDDPQDSQVSKLSTAAPPREMPRIRVANLRFLRGDFPLVGDALSKKSDLSILSSKKKVTFEEIAASMSKHSNNDANNVANNSNASVSEAVENSGGISKSGSVA